jgi:hypothetical protein
MSDLYSAEDYQSLLDESRQRIRELEAAFIKYTAHQMTCDLKRPCSCGWDDTVDALGLRTKATVDRKGEP